MAPPRKGMASRFANCLPKVEPMPDQMEAMLEISLVGRVKKKTRGGAKKRKCKVSTRPDHKRVCRSEGREMIGQGGRVGRR